MHNWILYLICYFGVGFCYLHPKGDCFGIRRVRTFSYPCCIWRTREFYSIVRSTLPSEWSWYKSSIVHKYCHLFLLHNHHLTTQVMNMADVHVLLTAVCTWPWPIPDSTHQQLIATVCLVPRSMWVMLLLPLTVVGSRTRMCMIIYLVKGNAI